VVIFIALIFLSGLALGPKSHKGPTQSRAVSTSHALALAMFEYANDHDNHYPDGKSSTEVFQKLMDGGYISDPEMLYLLMKSKIKAQPGQKLKPENVCWDVTGGVDATSANQVPLVFLTGYKVTYASGTAAVPLIKPLPHVNEPVVWFGESTRYIGDEGIAVTCKANTTMWLRLETDANGKGSISNFVPPDFQPDGHTYRQLTPDGVLP
jgi:hypothetical protein